jgi:hypothetical protein
MSTPLATSQRDLCGADPMNRPISIFALATLGACQSYAYAPVQLTSAEVGGRAAASYPLPPERPSGSITIATLGFSTLPERGSVTKRVERALDVRMLVTNQSDQMWKVDTREQRLELGNGALIPVVFAASDAGGAQIVTIAPGARRRIDVFFETPSTIQSEKTLPAFNVIWTVQTVAGNVTERAPFERVLTLPSRADYSRAYYDGWGPRHSEGGDSYPPYPAY